MERHEFWSNLSTSMEKGVYCDTKPPEWIEKNCYNSSGFPPCKYKFSDISDDNWNIKPQTEVILKITGYHQT